MTTPAGNNRSASGRSTRILCVDDHAFVAEGLRARLAMERDLEVVGWVSSADEAVDAAVAHAANLVILDIEMPGADAFDILAELRRRCPEVKVVILSAYVRDHYIDAALRGGAFGYVSKADDPDALIAAIRAASSGKFAMGPKVLERCQPSAAETRGRAGPKSSRLEQLTPRELQVLKLIARGMSRVQIARSIHRSPKTVDNHRAAIMQKLNISDRVELARFALSEGLVELE
jgi:two-component system response regulator NreC